MIKIHVMFFSTIRSIIGRKTLDVELPAGSSVKDLKDKISEIYPHAGSAMEGMLTSVNRIFSDDDTILADDPEIAFFPHITGG